MATRTKKATAAESSAAETVERAATAAPDTDTKADGAAAEKSPKETYIYVGASLPGIPANTTISGKIPDKLDVPFVRELVIPVDNLTDFIKKKAVTTSREAFCYRKSVEYANTIKK